MPCAIDYALEKPSDNVRIMLDRSDRLRKYRQLLRAMTIVIAHADRLGHEPLIAAMDTLKTAVAREAALMPRGQRRPPKLR